MKTVMCVLLGALAGADIQSAINNDEFPFLGLFFIGVASIIIFFI